MPQIKLIVEGGAMKLGPTVAQQLGPIGINIGKVIEETNKATAGFKGMKVPVIIDADIKTKQFIITVSSPPVSELIKKEIGAEIGSGQAGTSFIGNMSIEQVIQVAKTKMPNMLAKNLKSAVKLVIGSCVSSGVMIENKSAKEIMGKIDSGKYDSEISNERTQTSLEKKKELETFFKHVKDQQEAKAKAEQAAKEAEEAAKATAEAGTPAAAGTAAATPAVAAKAAPTATPAKEEKKEKPKKK